MHQMRKLLLVINGNRNEDTVLSTLNSLDHCKSKITLSKAAGGILLEAGLKMDVPLPINIYIAIPWLRYIGEVTGKIIFLGTGNPEAPVFALTPPKVIRNESELFVVQECSSVLELQYCQRKIIPKLSEKLQECKCGFGAKRLSDNQVRGNCATNRCPCKNNDALCNVLCYCADRPNNTGTNGRPPGSRPGKWSHQNSCRVQDVEMYTSNHSSENTVTKDKMFHTFLIKMFIIEHEHESNQEELWSKLALKMSRNEAKSLL